MSKQASKTMIGGFVVGAVVLIFAGVMIFGTGQFMKKSYRFVLFFEGSIKGLDVGAPVIFRGVKVGSVADIFIDADVKTLSARIPVIIEMNPKSLKLRGGARNPAKNVPLLVKRGLKAQLGMQSLVTGQMQIELDYYPDEEIRLVGKDEKYPEIPTMPSTFDKLTKTISELPIEDLFGKLVATLGAVKNVVESPEILETVKTLKLSVTDLRKLINDLGAQVKPLSASIDSTIKDYGNLAKNTDKQIGPLVSDVRTTVNSYGKLARDIDRHVDPIGKDVGKAIKVATSALKRAESSIKGIEDVVSKDSIMTNQIKTTLRELSAAARSIRAWADYLERHPEALIRGKGRYRR